MNIILCGFKSCGKSSVGKAYSQQMGIPFIDTDKNMLAETQMDNIRELYLQVGELEFRKRETACIQQLAEVKNSVIALGGGTLVDTKNLDLVKTLGKLYYLQVPLEILQKRILKQKHLPGYMKAPDDIQRHFESRVSIYQDNADFIIEVGNKSIDQIVQTLKQVNHGQ